MENDFQELDMNILHPGDRNPRLDTRLKAYLAAVGGISTVAASSAEAVVVSNTTPQTIGINQEVNIDFNLDGQIDFQIDHDRYVLTGGSVLDYLQVDKNDASSAANPLPIDNFGTFPLNGTPANSDSEVLNFTNSFGDQGGYAVGLKAGDVIGATGTNASGAMYNGLVGGTRWDFQEGDSFLGSGTRIRANRLIDEDQGQIDTQLQPSKPLTLPFGPQPEFPSLDDFIGNNGEVRYLGVRIDLNDAGKASFNNNANQYWYGWIGIDIENEADATGTVTGWAYESTRGVSIVAGDVGSQSQAGDFDNDGDVDGRDFLKWQRGGSPNPLSAGDLISWQTNYGAGPLMANSTSVPEPGSMLISAIGGMFLLGGFASRRFFSGGRS
ncbi:MAG: PEP-CTERM sorting domain-containing protein [Bythopirellula sp.]|nr:PEP-CTERM sorting domain-containing protein [Bythopirellula sp.]